MKLITLSLVCLLSIATTAQAKKITAKPTQSHDEKEAAAIMNNVAQMVNGVLTIGKDPHNGLTIIEGLSAIILNFADIMTQILKKKEIELSSRGLGCDDIAQELEAVKAELITIYAKMVTLRSVLSEQELVN